MFRTKHFKKIICFDASVHKLLGISYSFENEVLGQKVVIDQMFEEAFQSLKNVKIDVLIFQHLSITLIAIALA